MSVNSDVKQVPPPLSLHIYLYFYCDNLVGSEAPPVGCHTVLNDRFFVFVFSSSIYFWSSKLLSG